MDAWAQFRPAGHLWAALIHIGQHHDALGEWRWGHELPTFLAFADTFLEMAGSLPASDDPFVLGQSALGVVPRGCVELLIFGRAKPRGDAQSALGLVWRRQVRDVR